MRMHLLKRIGVCVLFTLMLFAVQVVAGESGSDSLRISATSESVMQQSTFTISISGTPDTPYYVWVKGTRNMSGNKTDSPPVVCAPCDYSSGVYIDRVTGPFRIGMHTIYGGNGSTILDDIPAFTHYNDPTDYYASVVTNDKGQGGITFETYSTKPGNYTIRVEKGADVQEVGIRVEPFNRPPVHAHIKELGTIRYVPIEGGFYGFYSDSGGHYDPNNLPEDFRSDGKRVMIEAITHGDQMTFHMWGIPIEITRIEDYSDPTASPTIQITDTITFPETTRSQTGIPVSEPAPAVCRTSRGNGTVNNHSSSDHGSVSFPDWIAEVFTSFFPHWG